MNLPGTPPILPGSSQATSRNRPRSNAESIAKTAPPAKPHPYRIPFEESMASHDPAAQSQFEQQKPGQPSPREAAVTPSGPTGDNPATAGPGKTEVQSRTPENARGHLNPSAPEEANITPGSAGEK
jgi:hypothetical protein